MPQAAMRKDLLLALVAKRTFKIGLNAEVTGAEALSERAEVPRRPGFYFSHFQGGSFSYRLPQTLHLATKREQGLKHYSPQGAVGISGFPMQMQGL